MSKNMFLVIIVVLSIVIGIGLGTFIPGYIESFTKQSVINPNVKELPIVGVTSDGNGVVGLMSVEVKPGSGLVLVNVNDLLADYDSQLSARNAALFAGNYTGVSLSDKDLIYNINVNASIIAGPSAGVPMTVATIAVLQNHKLKGGLFMTGAVTSDGQISGVGGIGEKARAAKNAGAKYFIIPKANYVTGYVSVKQCTDISDLHYCQIDYKADNVSVNKLLGLEVIEVSNIKEVLGVAFE